MRSDGSIEEVKQREWNGQPVFVLPDHLYGPIRMTARSLANSMESHPLMSIFDRQGPFDLIQVRNDLSMATFASRITSKYDIPFVYQISHLKSETEIEIAELGLESARVRRYIKGHAGKYLRNRISNNADLIFPISDSMKSCLINQGVETPMTTVYTGVNTNLSPGDVDKKLFRDVYNIPDKPLLLYMGSMSPIRRLDFLFKVLQNMGDRTDVHLAMVGGRKERNREKLEQAAKAAGVEDDVTFTGWVSNSEYLNSSIVSADIGLSPLPPNGVLKMNAPLKVLEYLNFGTPVVATDTPDQRQVLKRSGGGRIVSYDAGKFAKEIEDMLQSESIEEMGERGSKYVRSHRGYENIFQSIKKSYKNNLSINI
jgi:glycosyltransferase involved in cell wall biosynthesis